MVQSRQSSRSSSPVTLADHFVVYRSKDDPTKFVAHSIRTDQVGVAETVVEAVQELYCAMRALMDEVKRDRNVCWEQHAPPEVIELFLASRRLPDDQWAAIRSQIKLYCAEGDYWEPDVAADHVESISLEPGDSFWRDLHGADVVEAGAA